MTVKSLQSKVSQALRRGALSSEVVRQLVRASKDQGRVGGDEMQFLRSLPDDKFAPGAREDLLKLLDGAQSLAYVNLEAVTGQDAFGKPAASSVKGVTIALESGLSGLTQNSFWLSGKAKQAGALEVAIDGQRIQVKAAAGESAAALARKISAALPKGYSVDVNAHFPDGRAAVQVFRDETIPAELVKPVLEGKQKPVRVLITGYGKFGWIKKDGDNPSWQMAQKLAKKKFPGAEVKAVLLPVEWGKVDAFAKTVVEKYRPDVIINMGTGRHTIEVWGENKTDGADAKGVERHGEAAVEGGPQWLESTLPQEAIEKALERTEDAAAGGRIALRAGEGSREQRLAQAQKAQAEDEGNKYLCNYLNYRMLEATRGQGIMSGFFHVDDTTAPQEMEVVVEQAVIAKLRERGGG